MIATFEIPAATEALVKRHEIAAASAGSALSAALQAGVVHGADSISQAGLRNELGLRPGHGGQGLFGQLLGWMIDPSLPLAAVGVPANAPAAVYAAILNRGGTITAPGKGPNSLHAKALAVPVSNLAKQFRGPRQMEEQGYPLVMIKRAGRPPLLVEEIAGGRKKARMVIHWVLLKSVTVRETRWFDKGVVLATPVITDEAGRVLNDYVAAWTLGGALPRPSASRRKSQQRND